MAAIITGVCEYMKVTESSIVLFALSVGAYCIYGLIRPVVSDHSIAWDFVLDEFLLINIFLNI
jgi:23S rRNA A1618 N6-methylase RlmF